MKPSQENNAFRICEDCRGAAFLRHGAFPDDTYLPCGSCKGLGQIYLHPVGTKPLDIKMTLDA